MKRIAQQYAIYRAGGFSRRESLRQAVRDLGIRTKRLSISKHNHYQHSIHNWRIS